MTLRETVPAAEAPAAAAARPAWHRLMRWETGLVVLVIGIGVLGVNISSNFLSGNNIFYIGLNSGEIAIMALPMTLIIISGEIDLSVASTLGLSSAVLGELWSKGWPMPAIFVAVVVVGAAAGGLNAVLVTRLGLPSLAVTIGTLTLYRGIALILLGPSTITNFPARYTSIGINAIPGTDLSWSAGFFIVLAVVFAVVLHFTPFGRSVYAMGLSPEAAQFAGIRTRRIKTILFVVSGVICAFAGVLYTFRLATAVQDNGLGLELDVVAIALVGGVSIFGGKGTIPGVVLSVLAVAGIQNALFLSNFNQEATGVVIGGLLLLSVFIPNIALLSGPARRRLAGTRAALTARKGSP
jgi:rhamnose transport system permease protein